MVGHLASQASAVFKPKTSAKASSYQAHARTPKVEKYILSTRLLGPRRPSNWPFEIFSRLYSSPLSFHHGRIQSRDHVCAWYGGLVEQLTVERGRRLLQSRPWRGVTSWPIVSCSTISQRTRFSLASRCGGGPNDSRKGWGLLLFRWALGLVRDRWGLPQRVSNNSSLVTFVQGHSF